MADGRRVALQHRPAAAWQWTSEPPWGDTPWQTRIAATALYWSSHVEIPHVQDKRNTVTWYALRGAIRGQRDRNHNHRKLTNLITWTTALSNSKKIWAIPCRARQDGRIMAESFDKMWPTGEGVGKPLQYSCLENPMNSMKRQKDRTLKDELPIYYWRSVRNNSKKNEKMEPKQKQHTDVDVTGDGSKVQCCKEQYCIGTWNVRSMRQGKLKVANRKWQEWTLTFWNQWTKTDWNGWI